MGHRRHLKLVCMKLTIMVLLRVDFFGLSKFYSRHKATLSTYLADNL